MPCPAGKNIIGGGVATFNENIQVLTSTPLDDFQRWIVNVEPDDGATFGGGGRSAAVVNHR